MPDMPTISMTAAQQDRVLAAFKDYFGTATTAETVAAYKKMLTDLVKSQVISYETKKLYEDMETKRQACEAEVAASLNGIA